MNNLNGYKQWKDLFDENVSKVWKDESIPVLRNVSMLMFSINREIRKIQDVLHVDILRLRSYLTDDKLTTDSISNLENIDFNTFQTKNELRIPQKTVSCPAEVQIQPYFKSPTEFPCDQSESFIISDDEQHKPQNTNNSPEIKQKHRRIDFKRKLRHKRKLCAESLVENIREVGHSNDSSCKENTQKKDYNSVHVVENSLLIHQPCKIGIDTGTPQRTDSDLDFSIVQCTPVSKMVVFEKKNKLPTNIIKKKKGKKKNSTLTQMFFNKGGIERQEEDIMLQSRNYDSNQTTVTLSVSNKSIEQESAMGLTKMVSYLNKESCLENAQNSIIHSNSDVAELISSVRYEDFDIDTTLNSGMLNIETSHSSIKEQIQHEGLNNFLAKVQNIPDQLEAEPVVRGKAKQKLPGWSCKDCEQFYMRQGLNPDEILKLNKCSKHRGYYKPREDTVPGFWDMNVTSQESEKT